MHLDQLPGAHRTPHARSGQGPCQNRKRHRGRAPKSMKGRDHISVIGSLGDAHWSPSPGSARYTHVRRRRTRLNLLPSSADGRGDVDSTYPPWSPRSRLRRRGLSAPSSRFFSGRAKKVLQTMSARFSQSNMCTGRMNLVWLTSPIFDEGKLRSTPLLSLWPYRYRPAPQPACPPVDIPSLCRHGRLTAQESALIIAVWYEPTESMLKMRPASRPADGIPLSA